MEKKSEKNVQDLRSRIHAFKHELEKQVGELGIRSPIVVAVTKKQPEWKIRVALEEGFTIFGENYVQEALKKKEILEKGKEIHLIGPLQKNKVNKAIHFFHMIQAVDRNEILLEIEKKALKHDLTPKVLFELKISPEPTKHGLTPEEALMIAEKIRNKEIKINNTEILGIMGIASRADPFTVRNEFRQAVEVGRKIAEILGIKQPIFSLGMSNDYKIALEEGSNMIRIGKKIFGPRE